MLVMTVEKWIKIYIYRVFTLKYYKVTLQNPLQQHLTFIDGDKILILVEIDKTMVECMVGQYGIRQFRCWFHVPFQCQELEFLNL